MKKLILLIVFQLFFMTVKAQYFGYVSVSPFDDPEIGQTLDLEVFIAPHSDFQNKDYVEVRAIYTASDGFEEFDQFGTAYMPNTTHEIPITICKVYERLEIHLLDFGGGGTTNLLIYSTPLNVTEPIERTILSGFDSILSFGESTILELGAGASGTITWQRCEEGNCTSWENIEDLDRYGISYGISEDKLSLTIINNHSGYSGKYLYRAVRATACGSVVLDTALVENLPGSFSIGISPEVTAACPGEHISFDVTGDVVANDSYEVYECITNDHNRTCVTFKPADASAKTAEDFIVQLPDQAPVQVSYFLKYTEGTKIYSTKSQVINVLEPGQIFIGAAKKSDCWYYDTPRENLTASICDGMVNNAGDWDFAWQYRNADGGEWQNIMAYTDIISAAPQLPHTSLGLADNFVHRRYRIAFKRPSETEPKLFTDEVELKYYPKLLETFTYMNRHCTELFSPVFHDQFSECPLQFDWNFGDGSTNSTVPEPIHEYTSNGDYTVQLTVTYDCDCGPKSESVILTVPHQEPDDLDIEEYTASTYQVEKVIEASATTISDAWDFSFIDESLLSDNPYHNGMTGVWRQNASYVYNVPRDYDVAYPEKGTYTLNMFNWREADLDIVPNWIKANQITSYKPYGFETENKDVLDIYSAAIYGYEGQLPVAVGQNMEETEMAFTSFEPESDAGLDWMDMGHWTLGTGSPAISKEFNVVVGDYNMAKVEAPIADLETYSKFRVLGLGFKTGALGFPKIETVNREANVLCMKADIDDPSYTFVTFDDWLIRGFWKGKLFYYNPGTAGTPVALDDTRAHSGERCMKVTGTEGPFEQKLMSLKVDEGSYVISSWVSGTSLLPTTPTVDEGIQIEIWQDYNPASPTPPDYVFTPQGAIVDGWQQITGEITPTASGSFYIKFTAGTGGVAYIDDLRLHPADGNMKSYVYDFTNYRLTSELDENNYAAYYQYDKAGNLAVIKKETERGVVTVQESVTNVPK